MSGERTRILFVPAEVLAPELGRTFLDRNVIEVRTADSWSEALLLCAQWRPQLVVLRSEIDGEGAASFCRAARTQAAGAAPKLLLLTERLHADTDFDTGCDAHLVSPLGAEQLLATIAELVGVSQRRSERVPLDVLVHTEGFADEAATVDATLSTGMLLSEDGIVLEASRQLGVGASGRLQFFLPELTERLAVEACVRVALDEMRLLYVLEFVDLPPQHRALIRRYVQAQRAAA